MNTVLLRAATGLLALGAFSAAALAQPLNIVIINNDGAGEGFNDPTPAAPVGGNIGTTLGQQRLIAFQYAATLWGLNLTSPQPVRVEANFDPLTCNETAAVLGSAGARFIVRDFGGAQFASTWYGEALGNRRANADLVPNEAEVAARFSSNLGQPGCLTGSFFYLGLNTATPAEQVNLVTVLLHEFAHGLNFLTFTNGSTGAQVLGFPSIYDHFLLDTTLNKTWVQMTDAERAFSALNARRVVWTGGYTTAASSMLNPGSPEAAVTAGPASLLGSYVIGTAVFGPPLGSPGVSGEVMPIQLTPGELGVACNPLAGVNALAANNRIALIDRGGCIFVVKVKNAQNAGARGVIMANTAGASPPPNMGGTDPTITIPSVMITQADGNRMKDFLRFRSRGSSGLFAALRTNLALRAGADALGRVLIFTPNPFQGGSSISHWDQSAFPNLLMEPNINADLTHSLIPPQDLTRPFLIDIGW